MIDYIILYILKNYLALVLLLPKGTSLGRALRVYDTIFYSLCIGLFEDGEYIIRKSPPRYGGKCGLYYTIFANAALNTLFPLAVGAVGRSRAA